MQNFNYEIIRTGRKKTASITINEGRVRVIVPNTLSQARVAELVGKRRDWIEKQLRIYAALPKPTPREFVDGEKFSYLGRDYRLRLIQDGETDIRLKGEFLLCPMARRPVKDQREYLRHKLTAWYRGQAETELVKRIGQLTKALELEPRSIRIRDYKSRWGSCSGQGDISFNWRIIMAPEWIVDYVTVHEFCHLVELNHSPRFWKSVELFIPNWKECRDWLGRYGRTLSL